MAGKKSIAQVEMGENKDDVQIAVKQTVKTPEKQITQQTATPVNQTPVKQVVEVGKKVIEQPTQRTIGQPTKKAEQAAVQKKTQPAIKQVSPEADKPFNPPKQPKNASAIKQVSPEADKPFNTPKQPKNTAAIKQVSPEADRPFNPPKQPKNFVKPNQYNQRFNNSRGSPMRRSPQQFPNQTRKPSQPVVKTPEAIFKASDIAERPVFEEKAKKVDTKKSTEVTRTIVEAPKPVTNPWKTLPTVKTAGLKRIEEPVKTEIKPKNAEALVQVNQNLKKQKPVKMNLQQLHNHQEPAELDNPLKQIVRKTSVWNLKARAQASVIPSAFEFPALAPPAPKPTVRKVSKEIRVWVFAMTNSAQVIKTPSPTNKPKKRPVQSRSASDTDSVVERPETKKVVGNI